MTPAPDKPATLSRARAAFVTDRLLVGGDLDGIDPDLARAQLDELVGNGVTHILDTRQEWSDEEYVAHHAPTVGYLHLGVDDDGGTLPDVWFDEATAWLDGVLAEPDTRALVHCHMGVNRSPSLVFAYLLHTGHGVRESLDAIRSAWRLAVIDYADDALAWHHRRTDAPDEVREADRRSLADWRLENAIDPEQVIRAIRQDESVRFAERQLRQGGDLLRDVDGTGAGRCWLVHLSAAAAAECLDDYRRGAEAYALPPTTRPDDLDAGDLVLLWLAGDEDAGLVGYAIVTEASASGVDVALVFVSSQVLLTRSELQAWPEFAENRVDLGGVTDAPTPGLVGVGADHLDRIAGLLKAKAAG
ncbi:MAG: dual specificity protein phosphatase [Propionibacterium sp.]|nr:dual specificity protein phosphatase [Propionibacterium sp.]